MALAWDDLDDAWDDEAKWWAALAAEPPCGSWPGILELVDAARPWWHRRAACRDHPELDWFAVEDQDATQAICAHCPTAGPCGDAGQQERFGVWAGQARQMTIGPRVSKAPKVVKPPGPVVKPSKPVKVAKLPKPEWCSDCGAGGPLTLGRCKRCYRRARRRAAGAQPRPVGLRVAICSGCGEERPMQSRGLCKRCDSRERRVQRVTT